MAGSPILLLAACWWLPAQTSKKPTSKAAAPVKSAPAKTAVPAVASAKPEPPKAPASEAGSHKLVYGIEWRLIRAGQATIEAKNDWAQLRLESAGLFSKLYKVADLYTVNYDGGLCATKSVMDASEGRRRRETLVTFDRNLNHAYYSERDLAKDAVIRTADVVTPSCVHDVMGGLLRLTQVTIEPGQTIELPVSDGRKSAAVKVKAEEREEIKTDAGTFKTIRYDADVLNGIVYSRAGRVQIWVSDDSRRIPVQIKLRMNFPTGTVTLGLEKEEAP